MDRLRGWRIEVASTSRNSTKYSSNFSSNCNSFNQDTDSAPKCGTSSASSHDESYQTKTIQRPPPLRTSRTYDDDEAFTNVSLNLLSRYEAFSGISTSPSVASDAIVATLTSSKDRSSYYYDGLCTRLDRMGHLSQAMASLVQSVDRFFGRDLHNFVVASDVSGDPKNLFHPHHLDHNNHQLAKCHNHQTSVIGVYQPSQNKRPPLIAPPPRHIVIFHQNQPQLGPASQPQHRQSLPSTQAGHATHANQIQQPSLSTLHCPSSSNTFPPLPPQRTRGSGRRFFPDSTSSTDSSKSGSNTAGSSFFLRKKAKVENIDWKLAQAIGRVEALRLDGSTDDGGPHNSILTSRSSSLTRNTGEDNHHHRSVGGALYHQPSLPC